MRLQLARLIWGMPPPLSCCAAPSRRDTPMQAWQGEGRAALGEGEGLSSPPPPATYTVPNPEPPGGGGGGGGISAPLCWGGGGGGGMLPPPCWGEGRGGGGGGGRKFWVGVGGRKFEVGGVGGEVCYFAESGVGGVGGGRGTQQCTWTGCPVSADRTPRHSHCTPPQTASARSCCRPGRTPG